MNRQWCGWVMALSLGLGCATTPPPVDSALPEPEAAPIVADVEIGLLSVEEVHAAVRDGAFLVDARGPESFSLGHIPGAVNIPCRSELDYSKLPDDRSRLVIFYCGGPRCSASHTAALRAMELGHERVAEFKGGYPAWTGAYGAAAE